MLTSNFGLAVTNVVLIIAVVISAANLVSIVLREKLNIILRAMLRDEITKNTSLITNFSCMCGVFLLDKDETGEFICIYNVPDAIRFIKYANEVSMAEVERIGMLESKG